MREGERKKERMRMHNCLGLKALRSDVSWGFLVIHIIQQKKSKNLTSTDGSSKKRLEFLSARSVRKDED